MSAGDWWVIGVAALPFLFFVTCAVLHWLDSFKHQRNGDNSRAIGCIYRAWQHMVLAFIVAFCAALAVRS